MNTFRDLIPLITILLDVLLIVFDIYRLVKELSNYIYKGLSYKQ